VLVEVYYDGGWRLFDPAFGLSIRDAAGRVASYEQIRRNPSLVPARLFEGIERPGWNAGCIPTLYASGVHRFTYLTRVVNE
jgi:hypothetical protein